MNQLERSTDGGRITRGIFTINDGHGPLFWGSFDVSMLFENDDAGTPCALCEKLITHENFDEDDIYLVTGKSRGGWSMYVHRACLNAAGGPDEVPA